LKDFFNPWKRPNPEQTLQDQSDSGIREYPILFSIPFHINVTALMPTSHPSL
jgi:hypothetical protein